MTMASETVYVNSLTGNEVSGENNLHNQIGHDGCQSSFSCLSGCHEKSAPEGINGTSCCSESCLEQKLLVTENGACLHGKHGSCEACLIAQSQQYSRQRRRNSLQDLYMHECHDDGDDDDSDWEPVNHLVIKKWFCTNCTKPNFDDVCHCDLCGEHKNSKISQYDFPEAQISINSDLVQRDQELSSKMSTSIGFDERMLLHSEVETKSHPHLERPDRLRAIAASLATAGIFPGKCSLIPSREITHEELQMVHSMDHIEAVQKTSCMLSSYLAPDTYANEHSACAARIAAGLCVDLALSIMSGRTRNGFALVRPPGHHAGVKQAMGFCLHNNAAVAALAAQRAGAKKVLIVDWDVHHGNGTQEIFEGNKSVLYISLHRHEDGSFYPGTGAADEIGIMDAKGYSVNIPWSCGSVGDNDYIFAFQHVVLPIACEFDPDMTIISAGFDAARGDPLGCCDVTPAGYAQMTHMLTTLSQGKLLVILEGGYNLRSISSSATAVVKVLLGENPSYDMSDVMPSRAGLQTILQVMQIQLKFWPILKSSYTLLQSPRELSSSSRRDQMKKRKRVVGPLWLKSRIKRYVYELLYRRLQSIERRRRRRRLKRVCRPHLPSKQADSMPAERCLPFCL